MNIKVSRIANTLLITILFCIVSICLNGQNKLQTPTLNHFITVNYFSQKPSPYVIHVPAEYYGIEILFNINLCAGNCASKIIESFKSIYSIIKKTHPASKVFYVDQRENRIEITDTSTFNFAGVPNSYEKCKIYWVIPLDSTKSEPELIVQFNELRKKIEPIPIPEYTNQTTEQKYYTRQITKFPILSVASLEPYDKLINNKLADNLNYISSKLDKDQSYSVTLINDVSISRASLFSLFLHKSFSISLLSR